MARMATREVLRIKAVKDRVATGIRGSVQTRRKTVVAVRVAEEVRAATIGTVATLGTA